jgi:CubicO group peptidase (beta-lactamase class C family)
MAQAVAPRTNTNNGYDGIVDAVIARYRLPGIAVGVIDHGKVTYKRTFGSLPSGKPINDDTLFLIASNTKAMTATLLARLAEEGKLRWDDPVTKFLPTFRMYDPWVTEHMQVADLLPHHSGLPEGGGDLMLWPLPNRFTPQNVVNGLRYLKPAYSFRAGYAYDNTLYVVAGQVAAEIGGAPYATLLRREVFEPLGMSRCQVGTWSRHEVGNVAQPHRFSHGRYVPIPETGDMVNAATMDPAGGVHCSLDDMLTWAMNWLAPTPRQLAWLSPAQRQAEWTAYTPLPISKQMREWDGTLFRGYGRGWRISDVDGQMTVWHTGSLKGMYSALILLPFQKSGFVVLMNASADDARTVLDELLTKRFTAPEKARSVASYADELAHEDKARLASDVPDTSSRTPARPAELEDQLGIWQDPWFGKVSICAHDGAVRIASQMSPTLVGQVMRVGSRYLVQWDGGDVEAWLRFPKHAGGTLKMAKVDPDADFSYDYTDLDFSRQSSCK